jgi:hypothetical protein
MKCPEFGTFIETESRLVTRGRGKRKMTANVNGISS